MSIINAVVPVAGLGTRLLPATKSQPKEMLPVGEKPVVQYIAEELAQSGIQRLVFVTGPGKSAIENHFSIDDELITHLRESGHEDLLARLAFSFERKKLEYFDQAANERYVPYIVETSAGADRVALTLLVDAYREEEVEGETRVVLGLHPSIAPIKVGVFPLVKKDGMPEIADRIYHDLKTRWPAFYDDGGSVGRRYRRQDEAGTPFCVTVDGQTKEDGSVTVRLRDTLAQERVDTGRLAAWLQEHRITTVAMESTGVYWIPVFQVLETCGIEVILVNAHHAKNVPGRKSDVSDCQWLQYLHSVGLLRGSFRPAQAVCAARGRRKAGHGSRPVEPAPDFREEDDRARAAPRHA